MMKWLKVKLELKLNLKEMLQMLFSPFRFAMWPHTPSKYSCRRKTCPECIRAMNQMSNVINYVSSCIPSHWTHLSGPWRPTIRSHQVQIPSIYCFLNSWLILCYWILKKSKRGRSHTKNTYSWSSSVEVGEGSYLPNGQTTLVIALDALFLLFVFS